MEMARRERSYRRLASGFIILVLGAQAATLAVTAVSPGRLLARFYPIIEYPMYAGAHYENERVIGRWLLRGVLGDGSVVEINEQTLNLSLWNFVTLVDQVASGAPGTAERQHAIDTLIAIVRERQSHGSEIKTLRIDSYPLKVTRHGAAPAPSETVWSMSLP